jgi:putative aldouronate transport system permease protein
MVKEIVNQGVAINKTAFSYRFKRDMKKNYSLYILIIPVLAFYALFMYKPMYGVLMAFQDFEIRVGITGSDWVGFDNFKRFFADPYFKRNIINTVKISVTSIVFGFPTPIIFALLVNEISKKWFMRTVQTITYLPHFISLVVICGMIRTFVGSDGIITSIVNFFSANPVDESLLNNAKAFVPIFVASDIWQSFGWNSIIYLAALSAVDEQLYEAAIIDGAGRIRQTISVTIPSILPTITIMFILRLGSILSVGYEKIILLTNAFNAESSEILSYYIYKKGLISADYGLATAAGLFNSIINFAFVAAANSISKKVSDIALW